MSGRGQGIGRGRGMGRGQGVGRGRGRGRGRGAVGQENMGNEENGNNRLADVLAQIANYFMNAGNHQNPGPVGGNNLGPHALQEDVALERFQRLSPPKFAGETNPEVAEKWLDRIERIFATLNYPEERQITFAVFQLEEDAFAWWTVTNARWNQDQIPRTWENFSREFREKFIPPLVQEKREEEFIRLRQGSMTVAEYEAKFARLSKYAPALVATDAQRKRRFIQGLHFELQEFLVTATVDTYTDAIEKAQRLESTKSLTRMAQERKRNLHQSSESTFQQPSKMGRGTGGIEVGQGSQGQGRGGGASIGQTQGNMTRTGETLKGRQDFQSRVLCGYCGKSNHTENDCWRKNWKCLKCGSKDHSLRFCPFRTEKRPNEPTGQGNPRHVHGQGSENRLRMPGRMYTMDTQDAPQFADTNEGTLHFPFSIAWLRCDRSWFTSLLANSSRPR